MKDYDIIGQGKSANIYKVINEKTGNTFAVKSVKPEDLSLVEIDILSRVKSPYLIRSITDPFINTGDEVGIPISLKENNFKNFTIQKLSQGQIKFIIISLLMGMKCLHSNGFLHLDIKPGNCLYEKKFGNYKSFLSDFNTSIRCEDVTYGIVKKSRIGTLRFFPYETLETKKNYIFNDKSDIWSMGVTLLIILGFRYSTGISYDEDKTSKLQKVKRFWDRSLVSSEVKSTVEKLNLSETDKLELEELLVNMLKKDPSDRIGTNDLEKLNFFKNNKLEDYCYSSKPKQIFYIPYSSSNVLKGIVTLRNYFKRNEKTNIGIECYFLSIEIFIRIMALRPMELSNETLEKDIQRSFLASMNYYKQIKMSSQELNFFKNNVYNIIEFLKGDIGPNYYYYKSQYADDLVLIDKVILENYNLICLYNFLDIEKLLKFFRQNYIYKKDSKETIKYFKDLDEYPVPVKNTINEIENDRNIFSYKVLKSDTISSKESVPLIDKYQEIQKDFRNQIIEFLKSNIKKDQVNIKNSIKKIYGCNDIAYYYNMYFKNLKINIYNLLYEVIPEFSYGILEEDIFENLEKKGNLDSKYFIFKDEKNKVSLVILEDKKAIHYYSEYNEKLDEYFQSREFDYENNYDFRTNSMCKINEICIIFLIFYNEQVTKKCYDLIYLDDKTLKVVMCLAIFKSNIEF